MNSYLRHRLLPVVVLAIGYGGLHAVAAAWILGVSSELLSSGALREEPVLTKDGEPCVAQYRGGATTFRDAQGRPLPNVDRKSVVQTYGSYLPGPTPFLGNETRRIMIPFSDLNTPETYWYLRITPRRGRMLAYLEGYDRGTRRLAGYLHAKGFGPTKPAADEAFQMPWVNAPQHYAVISGQQLYYYASPSEPVDVSLQTVAARFGDIPPAGLLLATETGIIEVDFANRSVSHRAAVQGLTSLVRGNHASSVDDAKPGTSLVGRVGGEAWIWSDLNQPPRKVALPETAGHLAGWYFQNSDLPDAAPGEHFFRSVEPMNQRTGRGRCHFIWTNADGTVARTERIEYQQYQPTSDAMLNVGGLIAFPSPLVLLGGSFLMALQTSWETMAPFGTSLVDAMRRMWPSLMAVVLVGIACGWSCLRNERKYHATQIPLSVVLVGLFGLPALFAYWCYREWPDVQISPWIAGRTPQPAAPKGIEIFG